MQVWCVALGVLALTGCGRVAFSPGTDSSADTNAEALTYRDVVMADTPSGYWRLGDSGTTARDETGQYPGTFEGGCTHQVASALVQDADGATLFDGTSCLLRLGDVLGYPGNAPFSVEAWVNLVATDGYQIFFMKETRIGNNPMDGYALLNGPMGVYLERYVNAIGEVTEIVPIATGRFVHLLATFSGSELVMYIDGVAGSAKPTAPSMPTFSADTTIGALFDGFSHTLGALDEIAIYDHVVSAQRVALHHDVGINGPR